MRPRLAPSAVRIAISRRRTRPRERSRFARFAHAIRSTNATAPISTRTRVRLSPTSDSRSGVTPTVRSLSSGKRRSRSDIIAARSARAASRLTPPFRRPTMVRK